MSKTYVIDAIKAHLKARALTYKDLSEAIGLSEVSVKRIFASADCSLDRLEQICAYLQIEFADIFNSSPRKRSLISSLTPTQELEFAHNRQLLMVAVCTLNHWPVGEMWEHLHISRPQGLKLLRRLDEMGFLELLGPDHYRLLISHNFAWITNGPIMRMVQGMSQEFFNDPFDAEGEILRIINVRISRPSQAKLRKRLEKIAQEYADQARADSHLPLADRPPVSVCIAARAWLPQFMQDLVRRSPKPGVGS